MKRRIEQLINGRYEYEVPRLLLSQTCITAEAKEGENIKGDLHVGLEGQYKLKGIAFASHRRFVLGKERFSGNAVTIPYGVDVKGLYPGDVCQGEVVLSTNVGEYRIPFSIAVTGEEVKTSGRAISSLDAFTELARQDFREAFHVFLDPRLEGLLGEEERNIYRGMSKNPVTYQHLEEFLIGIGKKEAVHLTLDRETAEIYEVQSSLKDEIQLRKNTWGYFRMEVTTTGDFLEVEKRVITSEDFIGSVYPLEYIIRRDRMGQGRNYGKIVLKSAYETLTFKIMASKNNEIQVNVSAIARKRQIALAQKYLLLMTHQISYRTWYEETKACLEEMADTGYGDALYQLMLAYVYQSGEELEQADAILDVFKENPALVEREPQLEGFYLYLCKLTDRLPKEKSNIVSRVHYLYQRQEDSFLLLWILLQVDEELNRTYQKRMFVVDEELNRTYQKRMFVLERQYDLGCRSPFLYALACQMLQKDVTLLRKLNDFYMQVLRFARKQNMLTQEMAFRFSYLAGYLKQFSRPAYELLQYVYEKYPSKDTLENICKLIMLGNPRKPEYFIWYERAVEQEIRITRLYEYYIETMGRNYQKMLPQMIRMYFSYNNTLSDKKKAFVYANVIRNRELDKNTYQSYRTAMESFARAKLLEGWMNEDFAVLYQEFCMKIQGMDGQKALAGMLFTYRIYVDDPKVRRVVVCHRALTEEQSYPCEDGAAYISLYTPDACILFEDEKKRRYISTVDYNLQKLLETKETIPYLLENHVYDTGLLLSVCREDAKGGTVTAGNLEYYQKILESPAFEESYKEQIRRQVMEFYQAHMGEMDLREPLAQLDFDTFAKVNKELLVDVLAAQGMYVGAYDLLCEYGSEGVDSVILLRLCSRMILNLDFAYEEELLLLGYSVFREGKYDEVLLRYLVKHFQGPVDEMLTVWERAAGFQLEAYELEEKILTWSMFARVYRPACVRVLESYLRQAGKEQVVLAYFTFEAYGYFLDDKKTDDFVFQSLAQMVDKTLEMDVICFLALLKYYAEAKSWDEKEQKRIRHMLTFCSSRGLRFAFMKHLPQESLRLCQLEDKVFAEYRGNSRSKVTLYYTTGGEQWKREPLKNCYQGIFNKEFILFYGEILEYYFEETQGEETLRTETVQIRMDEVPLEGNTKYQMLNRMLAARQLKDEDVLEDTLKEYRRRETIIDQVFQIIT